MEYLLAANQSLRSLIGWIGSTEIWGVSLDIPAHFFTASVVFYLLATKGVRTWKSVCIIVALAALKELYDLSALLHHQNYLEPVKDIVFTACGAWFGHYLSRPVAHNNAPRIPVKSHKSSIRSR